MGGISSKSPKLRDTNSKVKFLLMGKPGVGKTSIVSSYQNLPFKYEYEPTVGCSLLTLEVICKNSVSQILIMDSLAEGELSLSCRLKSLQNCEILGIVFDLTDLDTWEDIKNKLKIAKENQYSHSHIIIIANKADENSSVDLALVKEFIESYQEHKLELIVTSAKTGDNVGMVFVKALELGYYTPKFRWHKIKPLLLAHKHSVYDDPAKFSWANMCEALPSLVKKKKKKAMPLAVLSNDILKRLISFI
jgi:GTPase SAR1 family protein